MNKKDVGDRLRMECHGVAIECLERVYGGPGPARIAIENEMARLGCSRYQAVMPLFCKKAADMIGIKFDIAPTMARSVDSEAQYQAADHVVNGDNGDGLRVSLDAMSLPRRPPRGLVVNIPQEAFNDRWNPALPGRNVIIGDEA